MTYIVIFSVFDCIFKRNLNLNNLFLSHFYIAFCHNMHMCCKNILYHFHSSFMYYYIIKSYVTCAYKKYVTSAYILKVYFEILRL